MKKTIVLLAVAGLVLALAPAASAALTASESFDYSTSTVLSGLNGGTGWSGAWSTTGLKTASGADSLWFDQTPARIVDGTGHVGMGGVDGSSFRDLSTTFDMNARETVYLSMLFTVETATTPAITVGFGRSSDNIYRGTARLDNGKLSVQATTTAFIQTPGTVYDVGKNYMLVMKRTWGGIFASVFEGDGNLGTTLATEPVTWQLKEERATGITVDRMKIEIDGVGGTVTRLDDIRVATDRDSAVGVLPVPLGTLIMVK